MLVLPGHSLREAAMDNKVNQKIIDLYDNFTHGGMNRR